MLTTKELKVYEKIKEYIKCEGCNPSIRDICLMAGVVSTSSAYRYVEKLKAAGLIDSKPGIARSITIKEPINVSN